MEPTPIASPITTAAIGLVALVGGFVGGQTLDKATIDTLHTQVSQVTIEKQYALDQYVYSQISSGRIPTIDVSITPPEDIVQAYIDTVGTTTLAQPDLFVAGVALSKQKGDYICK